MDPSAVVDVEWLGGRLGETGIQVVDASWHLPAKNRDAKAEFASNRIAGAVFMDLDLVADTAPRPPGQMLPTAERFAEQAGLAGLEPASHLVVYDTVGFYSSARAWWLLRTFGHDRVSVLQGGLAAWMAYGGPVENSPPPVPRLIEWPIRPARRDYIRDWRQVLENIGSRREQLVDVRPETMFRSSTADLYPGVREGHITGAVNLPRQRLLNDDDTLPEPHLIVERLRAAGLDPHRPMIAYCGSGITACVLALAADVAGGAGAAVYDGSWEEWGTKPDLPVSS